jgi:hypothetical protein
MITINSPTHTPRLVVSHAICPPLSPSTHANSIVIGPAVINNKRERVLFIGTQFSILYTSMYSPAGAASPCAVNNNRDIIATRIRRERDPARESLRVRAQSASPYIRVCLTGYHPCGEDFPRTLMKGSPVGTVGPDRYQQETWLRSASERLSQFSHQSRLHRATKKRGSCTPSLGCTRISSTRSW